MRTRRRPRRSPERHSLTLETPEAEARSSGRAVPGTVTCSGAPEQAQRHERLEFSPGKLARDSARCGELAPGHRAKGAGELKGDLLAAAPPAERHEESLRDDADRGGLVGSMAAAIARAAPLPPAGRATAPDGAGHTGNRGRSRTRLLTRRRSSPHERGEACHQLREELANPLVDEAAFGVERLGRSGEIELLAEPRPGTERS